MILWSIENTNAKLGLKNSPHTPQRFKLQKGVWGKVGLGNGILIYLKVGRTNLASASFH